MQCAGTEGQQVGVTEWFIAMGDSLLAWAMGDGENGMEVCGELAFIMDTGEGIRVGFIVDYIAGIIRVTALPNSIDWRQLVRDSHEDTQELIFIITINGRA